jgi:hypothetical protein
MLPDTFHTPRLILRPIAQEDAGSIFERYARNCHSLPDLAAAPEPQRY